MTNRVCVIPLGDTASAQQVVSCISATGEPITLKNKYFEVTLTFDFESGGRPPAVLWIAPARFLDSNLPPSGEFQDAEIRLLLRVQDPRKSEIPEPLREWEIENMAEIIDINLTTFEAEIRQFMDGHGRTSLLDEKAQPGGCRLLEALEMVNWQIKSSVGKSVLEQKVERLKGMLADKDPNSDSFEGAMSLMMELKSEIPTLPDAQRHALAAEIAMAFQAAMVDGEEDGEEEKDEHDGYTAFGDDE
jgi:hypothetical protein